MLEKSSGREGEKKDKGREMFSEMEDQAENIPPPPLLLLPGLNPESEPSHLSSQTPSPYNYLTASTLIKQDTY